MCIFSGIYILFISLSPLTNTHNSTNQQSLMLLLLFGCNNNPTISLINVMGLLLNTTKDPHQFYVHLRTCFTKGLWAHDCYPTLAREFQGFREWGKFVFRTLELTDTPTNLTNQVKVGHALDQSRSVQSRGPERAHQNNEPSRRSSRTDRRLSRQFWDD